MWISIKVLNSPGIAETSLEVSSTDTIQEIKSRLAKQLNIPAHQQKLVLKGKPLHDGSIGDYQITDGCKLHLMVSSTSTMKPTDDTFTNQLRLLASKWSHNPNDRDAFVTAFLLEMKITIDRFSLDDIEKLCADRLNLTA